MSNDFDETQFSEREKQIHDYAFKKGVLVANGAIEILHELAAHQAKMISELIPTICSDEMEKKE